MVLLTVLLQFEQLAFCSSRGSRTRNEYLLITLCMMTVCNSCSEPSFEASAVSVHELYFSAAHLLRAGWAADTLTPRKYIGFFFPPHLKKSGFLKRSEDVLSAKFEKRQLNIQYPPLCYRSTYKSEGQSSWLLTFCLLLFT